MSEFIYEFIKLPDTKEGVAKVLSSTKHKEFSQIFFFVDFNNKDKNIYSSKEYAELKKPYKVSQIKPYF